MSTELKAGIVPWTTPPRLLLTHDIEAEAPEVWLIASNGEDARRLEIYIGRPSVRARLLRALEEALSVLDDEEESDA